MKKGAKIALVALIIIIVLVVGGLYSLGFISMPQAGAKLTAMTGAVEVNSGTGFKPATLGMDLQRNDLVMAGPGASAEITFFGSSVTRLDENTQVKISDAEYTIITACLNFIRDSCYRSEYFFPYKKELKDNLYFSPFFFLAEMKKLLEYYKSEIDWKRFFKIVSSYKEEYKIIASLCIMRRVFNLEIPVENVKIKNIYAGTFIRLSKIISKDKPIKHLLLMRDIDMFYEGMKLINKPTLLIRKLPWIFKRATKKWKI